MNPTAAEWRARFGDERGTVTVWAIGAIVAVWLIVGLVHDGGAVLRARSEAFSLAGASARAGAQTLDPAEAVQGNAVLDPVAAERAALNHLAARGASGTVTVTGATITVTATTSTDLELLDGVGPATVSATATVDATKVDTA